MVTPRKSTEKEFLKEDNNMNLQSIYNLSLKTSKNLAISLNKIVRKKVNQESIPDYLDLVNSEFIYTCKMCEKSYTELESILKRFRVSPHGKTKAAVIIYANFRMNESYSFFQNVRDNFIVDHNHNNLIKSLMIIRKQIRSIYVCKY